MKKLFLTLSVLLLLAGQAFGATYYVNSSSSGGDGTTTATSGANAAFATIAAMQAKAGGYAAGDSILFNKGQTWRETLTVPSSGSSGSPITFGAYGTGANPIISGADLVSPGGTWTQDVVTAVSSVTFEDGTNGAFWGSGGADSATAYAGSHGWKFENASMTGSANAARTEIIFYWRLDSASPDENGHHTRILVVEGGAWNAANMVAIWVRNTSGTRYLDLSRGSSSSATYAISADTWYKIRLVVLAGGGAGVDSAQFWVDDTSRESLTGLTLGSVAVQAVMGVVSYNSDKFITYVDNVSYYTSDSTVLPYRWYATLETEPKVATFNDLLGTKAASAVAVDALREWYWTANTLYVYSVNNPNTDYASPGIEVGARNSSVIAAGKSYVTFDGLTLSHGNHASQAGVQLTGFDHGIMQNCIVKFHAYSGTFAGDSSDDAQFIDNEFAYNGLIGLDVDSSDDVLVSGGSSHHNQTISGSGYYIGALTPKSDDCIIQNVTAYSNGAHGIAVDNATGILLENNTIYSNTYNGIYIPLNAATVTARGNNIYSNGDNGIMVRKTSAAAVTAAIHSNLIRSNTTNGIYVYEGSTATIYNNTLYGNTGSGIKAETAGTTATFKNNILSSNVRLGYEGDGNPTLTGTNNIFYNNTIGAAVNFVLGATDLTSNPLLTATYALGAGSPAIDAGVAIPGLHIGSTIVGGDAAGNTNLYGEGIDIGAYEKSQFKQVDELFNLFAPKYYTVP